MTELKQRCQRLTHFFEQGSFDVPQLAPLAQEEEGDSPSWEVVCLHVTSLGFSPAVVAVASAIIYDTLTQHGDGEGKDSLSAIIQATGPRVAWNEIVWLDRFLNARFKVLFHPSNPELATHWRKSSPRVSALRLLLQKHPQLFAQDDYERAIARAF